MDSTINLLPEKDKLLKRGGQPKSDAEMVEMTKPQDRVFHERVVRLEGLLGFFKRIFRRAPKLPDVKPKPVVPPAPPKPDIAVSTPAAPVTKLETMLDRMPGLPPPPKPPRPTAPMMAGRPPTPPRAGNFFSKIFRQAAKPTSSPSVRPPLVVPPPRVASSGPASQPPAPVQRAPAWTPPPPRMNVSTPPPPRMNVSTPPMVPPKPPAPPPPAPKPALPATSFPPPIPTRSRAVPHAASVTQAQPMFGGSLNVNLVPEQYQPEASVRERLLAGVFVGGAMLLVAVAVLGLHLYQGQLESKVQSIDDQLFAVNDEINTRERDDLGDAMVLQQRTGDVKRVLDQHVYWDVFFQKLEDVTLPSVAYTTMSVDVAGSVTLGAQAKTFNDVGAQLLTYQRAKDFITDVTISGATKAASAAAAPPASSPPGQSAPASQSVVSFSVTMRVNPVIFYRR